VNSWSSAIANEIIPTIVNQWMEGAGTNADAGLGVDAPLEWSTGVIKEGGGCILFVELAAMSASYSNANSYVFSLAAASC
jgi:hypothetical protein